MRLFTPITKIKLYNDYYYEDLDTSIYLLDLNLKLKFNTLTYFLMKDKWFNDLFFIFRRFIDSNI